MYRRTCAIVAALVFSAASAWAQQPAPAQPTEPAPELSVIRLEVSPAAAPYAALKYRLLPEYTELTPGNAAPLYYRALVALSTAPGDAREQLWQQFQQRSEDEKFSKDEVASTLKHFRQALDNVHDGARREHCDWELRIRDLRGSSVVNVVLEDVQQARNLSRLLSLKARLEITDNKPGEALQTLQTGFALSRDLTQTPTLVNGLVGIASTGIMADEVERLIQQPGAPNLYWALTSLPQPFVDLRAALEQERALPQQLFPVLRDAETAQRTPAQWRALLDETIQQLQDIGGEQNQPAWQKRLATAALVAGTYPQAKKWLISQGRPADEVDNMPEAQVIVLHAFGAYRYAWDELFKWTFLPYWQAAPEFEKTEARLKEEGVFGGVEVTVLPLANLLLPAVKQTVFAQARLERRLAELRYIEALRLHAAETGKFPASLDEIHGVPLPVDAVTGKQFGYKLEGNVAVLEIPIPPGMSPSLGKRYELTLRGK